MDKVICVYKELGLTPLETIYKLKAKYPKLSNKKIGYAGRLDPMAQGLLLLLIGDENKKRKRYELLGKTYLCEIIFGFSTDTYDLLGKITNVGNINKDYLDNNFENILKTFLGKSYQKYPPYSSI